MVAEQSRFLDGVTISQRSLRQYPMGSMMGHTLGYVKQMAISKCRRRTAASSISIYEGDDIGVEGIEKTMERTLRGRAGRRVFPKDEHGKIINEELIEERDRPDQRVQDVFLDHRRAASIHR